MWRGQSSVQPDKDFLTFDTMEWGVRAAARVLLTYWYRGRRSIRRIITEWAPPSENNTEAYVTAVAECIGQDADKEYRTLGLVELCKLCDCIFWHENGEQVDENTVIEGVDMALYNK